jgi:hypothetical protein
MESYFLKNILNETDAKIKREQVLKTIDDFLDSSSLRKILEDNKEARDQTNEKHSRSSGVHVELNAIMKSMKQFKGQQHRINNDFMSGNDDGEDYKHRLLSEISMELQDQINMV